jgi:plastocyanin
MTNILNLINANRSMATAKKIIAVASGFLLLITVVMVSCSKKNSAMSGNIIPVATNTVSIAGMAFSPASITTTTGTTVTWTNNDNMAHTVTANDNSFDSGSISAGGTFSKTFSTVGSFAYHCSIHPSMTGTVVVK